VLLSRTTALGIGPVTDDHLERLLTAPIDLKRIRQDRILHEALTCHADPLRLALVCLRCRPQHRHDLRQPRPQDPRRRAPRKPQVHDQHPSAPVNPRQEW
jgi:hypothetical protein